MGPEASNVLAWFNDKKDKLQFLVPPKCRAWG